jgi:hypothetical protein
MTELGPIRRVFKTARLIEQSGFVKRQSDDRVKCECRHGLNTPPCWILPQSIGTLPVALLRTLRAQQRRSPIREVLRVLLGDSALSPNLGQAPIFVHDRAWCWRDAMGQMMVMTEYRTKPGRRDELFRAFERLLAHQKVSGRDFIV